MSLPELLDSEQPVMLNFIFTSCTAICPAMSATFASVQKKLGSDSEKLHMISVKYTAGQSPGEHQHQAQIQTDLGDDVTLFKTIATIHD